MKRITGERLKPITAALLLAAVVLVPAARVRADSGQTASQSRTQGAQDDDAALMEFLGGIGSEDDEWIDYLARTDPTKIASQPKTARPDGSKPSDPPQASASSSSGSEKK